MIIGVITAMSREFALIERLMTGRREAVKRGFHFVEGVIGENTIVLMQSGIGKVNAAIGAAKMVEMFNPHLVISTGVAGGLDSTLSVMDIVVSRTLAYHDVWCGEGNEYGQVQGMPLYFNGDESVVEHISRLSIEGKIHCGLICSGDQFITDRTELNRIKESFPDALAVDMESAAIAQLCYVYQVPFVSCRIISDTPGAENHQQQYEDFWGTIADHSFKSIELVLNTLPNRL